MKIAIFTNNYLPNPYGVTGSIESFRKEFEKMGHTVYIFAPFSKGYVDENPRVYRFPSIDLNYKISFPLAIPYSYKIGRILDKLEIDIIHSQHPNLLGWEAKRWAKKKNIPLVFTWHTLYDQYAHFAPLIPEKIAAWWTIKNATAYANKADQVVTPTNSVKEIIRNWGVKNENLIAIPTGVEEIFFENSKRDEMRSNLGIKKDEIALLLLSRITTEKNLIFLAKAVSEVLRRNEKIKFILAGEGSELENMKEIFMQNKTQDKVVYLGIVNAQEKKNIYAAGDIFVFSSKSETQGMIISEAMYMGLPVVALDAPGIKDLVANQVTGLLVKEEKESFVSAVERLIGDESLRIKFSENAKKLAKNDLTATSSAIKMLEVYKKAISRKK